MGLHLDARQRAMLQEMGVTVWAPVSAPPSLAPAPSAQDAAARAPGGGHPAELMPADVSRPAERAAASAPARSPAPTAAARAAASPAPSPAAAGPAPGAAAWHLHTPQPLYPDADPAQTPAALGAGWLVVAESSSAADPFAGGDAGRLLGNMLRAMGLHRHPRVFFAALERPAPGAPAQGGSGDDVPARLAEAVAALQPAMVLLLGHAPARAALASGEPLARLRAASPHALAGCPAVVTCDPAFLLRSPESKATAWADLCRALATVRRAAAVGSA